MGIDRKANTQGGGALDAVEAVVDVVGESSVAGEPGVGTPGGGVAHRGHLLECDADAAARGVFDGLLAHISEAVGSQAVSEEQSGYGERAGMSMGIDMKVNSGAAAHLRLVICVSLRMAASAEAPSYLMSFASRLRARGGVAMVREQICQRALTQRRTLGQRRT